MHPFPSYRTAISPTTIERADLLAGRACAIAPRQTQPIKSTPFPGTSLNRLVRTCVVGPGTTSIHTIEWATKCEKTLMTHALLITREAVRSGGAWRPLTDCRWLHTKHTTKPALSRKTMINGCCAHWWSYTQKLCSSLSITTVALGSIRSNSRSISLSRATTIMGVEGIGESRTRESGGCSERKLLLREMLMVWAFVICMLKIHSLCKTPAKNTHDKCSAPCTPLA